MLITFLSSIFNLFTSINCLLFELRPSAEEKWSENQKTLEMHNKKTSSQSNFKSNVHHSMIKHKKMFIDGKSNFFHFIPFYFKRPWKLICITKWPQNASNLSIIPVSIVTCLPSPNTMNKQKLCFFFLPFALRLLVVLCNVHTLILIIVHCEQPN